jgi:hypothetical protein
MSRIQLSINVNDFDAKVWARDPDGVAWGYYTVLEHIETS